MRTVRDFVESILPYDTSHEEKEKFFDRPGRHDFWRKLCRLGAEKATKKASECDDIDATAPLTDEEWAGLEAEFRALGVR